MEFLENLFTKYAEYCLFRKIKSALPIKSEHNDVVRETVVWLRSFGKEAKNIRIAIHPTLTISRATFRKSIYALSAKNPYYLNHLCFFAINQSGRLLYLLGVEAIEEYLTLHRAVMPGKYYFIYCPNNFKSSN